MKRREFIRDLGLAGAGMALAGSFLRAQTARPNVLLIIVDQLRYPRFSTEAFPQNIARIAKAGVSFSRHFVSAVPCSPSRACLMTGTYTTQNRMFHNCDFVEGKSQPSLDPKIPSLGHIFGKAGYRTPYRGKWHLTRKADRNTKDPLLDYGFEGWKPPEALFGGGPYNGQLVDPMYAREAADWLGNSASHQKPWFMVCSLINPHDICAYPRYYPLEKLERIKTKSAPPNYPDDLSTKPACQREYREKWQKIAGAFDPNNADAWRRYLDYYIECQEMVDRQAGKVLDALEKSGQKENTLVVFTSDHGEQAGSHQLRTKGCFAYEEVMTVPLIFSWPGHLPANVSTEALASNVDLMPTLVALAGISNPNYMAGRDLSPVLADPGKASVRDEVIYHSDWEVVSLSKQGALSSIKAPYHLRCLREREWKYVYYFDPESAEADYELYHLKDDPLEMTNLAADPGCQKKLKEMHSRLMDWEEKLVKEYKS